jgi:hypothetical protein
MRLRTLVAGAGVMVGALVLSAGSAGAGGWAVTTLDSLMAAPVAGESTEVGYTILQHGVTPVAVDDTFIVVQPAKGEALRFAGRPEGPVGHHVASVTFPSSGQFTWTVEQGWFGPQDLGTIDVVSTPVAATSSSLGSDGSPAALRIGLLAATLMCAAVFGAGLASRRRRPSVLTAG